ASLLHLLARPARAEALAAELSLPRATVDLLIAMLEDARVLRRADEPEDPSLTTWEHHDLVFHARTRNGRHDYPVGGTYRFLGRVVPPPATRPVREGAIPIPLDRPDLAALAESDPPFSQVYESRASVRVYGDEPITARQLGEFLYRVARVQQRFEADVE